MHLNPFTHWHPAGPLAFAAANPLLGAFAFGPAALDPFAALAAAAALAGDQSDRLRAALFAPRLGATPAGGDPRIERELFANRMLLAPPHLGDAGARLAQLIFGGNGGGGGLIPSGVAAGTYTSVTVDLYGRVTAGTNPTATAIPAGAGLRGMIDGLITAKNTSTTVTVAAGSARDGTDAATIHLSSATTKTLQSSGAWAAGTGSNGLDTGARANSTWYHVWAISQAAGANPDVLFSTSATAPTMPSGYTLKRRIGAVRTDGSGNVLDYVQRGDEFWWGTPVADVSATNPGTTAVSRTLTVPGGVSVKALMTVAVLAVAAADAPGAVYVSDLNTSDVAAGGASAVTVELYGTAAETKAAGAQAAVWTSTASQVRSRLEISAGGTTLYIVTNGWLDPRGRNG